MILGNVTHSIYSELGSSRGGGEIEDLASSTPVDSMASIYNSRLSKNRGVI